MFSLNYCGETVPPNRADLLAAGYGPTRVTLGWRLCGSRAACLSVLKKNEPAHYIQPAC